MALSSISVQQSNMYFGQVFFGVSCRGCENPKWTKENIFFPDDHPNVKRELERVLKESSKRRGSEARGDAKWTKVHSAMAETCDWAQRPCEGFWQCDKLYTISLINNILYYIIIIYIILIEYNLIIIWIRIIIIWNVITNHRIKPAVHSCTIFPAFCIEPFVDFIRWCHRTLNWGGVKWPLTVPPHLKESSWFSILPLREKEACLCWNGRGKNSK